MKKIMLIAVIALAGKLEAQDYMLGVKGGVNYAQSVILNVVDMNGVDMNSIQDQKGMGLVFGGFVRATYGKVVLQPEILFSEHQELVDLADANVQNMDLSDLLSLQVDQLDFPLLIGYKAFNTIRLMGGPVFSHTKTVATDPLFQIDNLTMGYAVGIGFDIEKLTFDARYMGSLGRFQDYLTTDNGVITVDSRQNIFQFTAGYKIFK